MFTQLLINGLIAGSIYALVASGFSLIYSTSKFVNFAHGAVVAFSAYLLFLFSMIIGWNFWVSIIFTLIVSMIIGYGLHKFYSLFRARKSSSVILLIVSFGVLVFLESLILMLYGAEIKTVNPFPVQKGISIFGGIITPLQITLVLVAILLFVALFLFMKHTKTGKAIRAVSDSKEVSEIIGISAERIYGIVFIIASLIGAIAGILIGLEQNLEPTMGSQLIIKGFTGAVIGGIGSVPGAIAGSAILGFAENFGIWYLPSGYKDAIAFVLLFIFLLFMPQGLFGRKK